MDPFDWNTGLWRRPDGKAPVAEIVVAGDWAAIRDFSDPLLKRPEAVYGNLLPVLRESHLRIVNLECPLTRREAPLWKSGAVLKGLPEHIASLTAVPFEIATLGNNHVFDYGADAFMETRDLLIQRGVQFAGAGPSSAEAEKPAMVTVNGVTLAVVSFGEGEDLTAAAPDKPGVLGWEINRITGLVRTLRAAGYVVIVVCHGGVEYIPFPPPYLAQALQDIADAGANLVIGHHPHVPQGVKIHKGVPICFSLGNFVFFQPTDLIFRKIGYLVKARVSKDGVETLCIIPYAIESGCLALLKDAALKKALGVLKSLSAPFYRPEGVAEAWHGFLKYYGTAGFKAEIAAIMEQFEKERPKGAAMFRNRLTTLQHSQHLTALMTRIMEGSLDDAPQWAVDTVAEFFTRKVADGLPG